MSLGPGKKYIKIQFITDKFHLKPEFFLHILEAQCKFTGYTPSMSMVSILYIYPFKCK